MDAAHGNGGGPTHLYRSIVTLKIGLSAVAFGDHASLDVRSTKHRAMPNIHGRYGHVVHTT
jgi:hypothetical protein